jgi:hypothetical protein
MLKIIMLWPEKIKLSRNPTLYFVNVTFWKVDIYNVRTGTSDWSRGVQYYCSSRATGSSVTSQLRVLRGMKEWKCMIFIFMHFRPFDTSSDTRLLKEYLHDFHFRAGARHLQTHEDVNTEQPIVLRWHKLLSRMWHRWDFFGQFVWRKK